jgi:hypothetical protein
MSSWANRGIPRRRDLMQIPEPLRPVIIPRAEQPAVVQSELIQKINRENNELQNELIYPIEPQWKPSLALHPFQGGNSIGNNSKSMAPLKHINAKELIHNEKTYVFVILRNIQQASDNDLWLSCYHSIRQFYTNQIIIIDDNSTINTFNGKLINTEIIQSEHNGAGEILPYYYFNKHKWADTMIFLHDSMMIYRLFTEDELDHEVAFHWHFTETNDNLIKKTATLLSVIHKSNELEEYIMSGKWIGCFGCTCIIDLSVVEMLEKKYEISKLTMYIRTRKQRELVERLIGMLLSYEKKVTSNFGDIIKYPSPFETFNLKQSMYNIQQANYNTAIIKLWRGR